MLTDVQVRQAKPRDRDYKLADSRGLFLLVKTSGSRWWRYKYRYGGKEKLLSLGVYPDVSLAQAREGLEAARQLLGKGIDPSQQRKDDEHARQQARASTFAAVAEAWYQLKLARWAVATADKCRFYLDRELLPALGDLPIANIRRRDLVDVLRGIEGRKTYDIAKKCREWLGGIFRFAVVSGFIEANPATDLHVVAAIAPPSRNQPHLTLAELPEFLRDLDEYGGDPATIHALRLIMLTACRPGEVRASSWSEFDLDAALWTIPAERMKMRRTHIVPLPRQAVQVLRQQHSLSGHRGLVFPGRDSPLVPISENTLSAALHRIGYKRRQTPHGFRHLISTSLNEQGYNRDWIERQLAHGDDDKIRETYNKAEYLEQRRTMMQSWADLLDRLSERGS